VLDKKTVIAGVETSIDEQSLVSGNRLVGWIVSYDLDPAGKDFKIFEGRTKIGRSTVNNIVIDKPEISDEHVLLLNRDNKFIIQDQLSANGTFVNGKKVEERNEVKDNDIIKLGSISFKLKII
jgi:pSer/pThr/pTyr-binding forkhead associated (FHA) protein